VSAIYVALISGSVSIFVAALTYLFTKFREREADWRQQKLEHYKELLEAVSGIVENDATPDAQRRYAKATNVIGLVASQEVIVAMERLRKASRRYEGWTMEEHDDALSKLLLAIRKDLNIRPEDDPATFKYKLWTSGAKSG